MAVYTGDMFHHPSQIEHPEWSPLFDVLPELSVETRRTMFERARREGTVAADGAPADPGSRRLPASRRHRALVVSHPILADRSKLGAVCIDMGSVVVDERLTWVALAVAGRPSPSQAWPPGRPGHVAGGPPRGDGQSGAVRQPPRYDRARRSTRTCRSEIWKEVTNRDRPLKYAAVALERLAARHPLVMVANQGLHARGLLEAADLDRHFSHDAALGRDRHCQA